jgi:aconitase A
MSGKNLSPEELRKLTNVIDLLDDGVENGSDSSSTPITELPRMVSASDFGNTLDKRPALFNSFRFKVISSILLGFAILWIVTIDFSLPTASISMTGTIESCSPARRFGVKMGVPWKDCDVTIIGSGKSVHALSRDLFAAGTTVTVTAIDHPATGVTTYQVSNKQGP